jgi:hypothetical protein
MTIARPATTARRNQEGPVRAASSSTGGGSESTGQAAARRGTRRRRNEDDDVDSDAEEDVDFLAEHAETLISPEEREALLAESRNIEDNNLETTTKRQYLAKIVHILKFFAVQYSHVVVTDANGKRSINIELLEPDMFPLFLASFCKKKPRNNSNSGSSSATASATPAAAATVTQRDEYYSYQHINGYWSAFSYYIKDIMGCQVRDSIRARVKRFLAGYERKIEKMKTNGEMSIDSGKAPLSFSGVRFLAKTAFGYCADFSLGITVHLFMLLCWNLLARCISVASLCFDHISWEEDSLTVVFPTHKGDKEGKNAAAKHIYANPLNPVICPILSLAIFVFTRGVRIGGTNTIVFGGAAKANENIFSKWLSKICRDNAEDLLSVGVKAENVGTHSFRKGMATFLNGIPGGPSPISIFLRAGWSLGSCFYLHFEWSWW